MDTEHQYLRREITNRQTSTMVRRLFADASAVIFVMGSDFRPVWCSSPDNLLFGRPVDAWNPGTLGEQLHPDDQVWLKQRRHELLGAPFTTVSGNIRVQDHEGGYAPMSLVATNRFGDPDINGLVITITPLPVDLAETSPDADLARCQRAANEQRDMLSQLQTEIQSELTAISRSVNTIRRTRDDDHDHVLDAINSSTASVDKTLTNILELTVLAAGSQQLRTEVLSLGEMIDTVVAAFEASSAEHGINVTTQIDPDVPQYVRGDPARLEHVLHRLVSRVIRSSKTGTVTIELSQIQPAHIEFRVKGPGLVSEAQPPTRVQPSGDQRQPTIDVDLMIVRQLVELMGGSIHDEANGSGTSLRFDVPFGHARRIEDRPPVPAHSIATAGAHVLVVDDSDVNRLLASSQLERLGYTSEAVESGQEALEALRAGGFDIILMDWDMPGMDGLEVTRRWRAESDPDHLLPIITMTASAMAGDRERCLDAGASDYLSKPVSISDLQSMINRWVSSTTANGDRPPGLASPSTEPQRTQAIDESRISELIDDLGDINVVRSIVTAFVTMVPQYRAAAEDAMQEGDRATIRRSAHTLKSTALMLGIDDLAQACVALEAAAVEGTTQLASPVAEFARCCHLAELRLNELSSELGSSQRPRQ